ncbi:hypothetical protein [Metasolibacillus meyeri]|uniref:hypothetical protein n=1 Tax=Metasolibacillus meyeri TaxID=1071052 RepID=UPI000D31BF5A|nr:hypothetical protein [Metasolibacillus meyeri]
MAMNEERLVELFRKLPEQDQHSMIDFAEYLNAKKTKQLQEFYANLPVDDEPLSNEEIRQIQETDKEPMLLDDFAKEMGWNVENPPR